ncbi:hypothetical protein BDA99DRAFT_541771 [Phascolomyces articulosus]|uniref:Uncharacterized protein n=1 Tax=Phascolomyces articulosus TaxID=60185 RepID=A0AAD5P9F6_9FUNG|nr:hypothetical protein BDA99DRAFT_541771 [Phascolomyces articulosus]
MDPSPTGRRPDLTAWGKRSLTLLTGFHISPANIQKPKESNLPWKVNDQIIAESEIISMGTSIGANESSDNYYPSNVCSEQKRDSSVWDAICNRANRDSFPLKTRRRECQKVDNVVVMDIYVELKQCLTVPGPPSLWIASLEH